jgi:AcrR family transcriptional regulator
MINPVDTTDWREARRRSAREDILDAAWSLVADEGLTGLSLRDLARRAGITPPTVYAYFESKIAIYDAMFGQAATQFAETTAQPFDCHDPKEVLLASVHRFFGFCMANPVRYQLLFQRVLPGFEPSADSYAPAVRALGFAQEWLALNGVTEARHLDLWTALVIGLVDQQMSNDPGGDRWIGLVEEATSMFLTHCQASRSSRNPARRPNRTKGTRS